MKLNQSGLFRIPYLQYNRKWSQTIWLGDVEKCVKAKTMVGSWDPVTNETNGGDLLDPSCNFSSQIVHQTPTLYWPLPYS